MNNAFILKGKNVIEMQPCAREKTKKQQLGFIFWRKEKNAYL